VLSVSTSHARKKESGTGRKLLPAPRNNTAEAILWPDIREPRPLTESLATIQPDSQHLMLDPEGTAGFDNFLTAHQEIIVFTGPEGGFTQEECAEAQAAGFRLVSLGPRILHTETASVVALGIMQNIAGDLRSMPAEEA